MVGAEAAKELSMATTREPPSTATAPPEPELTPSQLIARAVALRPKLVERQAETEARRYYSRETHDEFRAAGFYRTLIPRRFGGYEFDFPTFTRLVIELAHGCPSSAWCLCLGAGHAMQVASWFPEQAQIEIFGDGEFICPAVAAPTGIGTPTEDGWEITATVGYGSGVPYSTHFMGQTLIAPERPDDPPGPIMLYVAPRSEWTMLDDWGDLLGLKGSGSHSVKLDNARIPAHFALPGVFMVDVDVEGGTVGSRLHGNHLYAGRALSYFQAELGALAVGMVKGAIDEYEQILLTRKTQRPPLKLRAHDPDYQRWLGFAVGRVATAEAALIHTAEEWMECARRGVEEGIPFTKEDDLRLNIISRECMAIAWDVMQEIIFRTAGSSATKDGTRLQRIFRDLSMDWGHFGSIIGDSIAREFGMIRLGLPPEGPGTALGAER
jgi:3-hydroxy-9,10-secoandrosta-1,3,5(10)-triene-9,17-dione monooxygenase